MISDPMKLISKRIVMELESHEAKGKRKYVIFTRPLKGNPNPEGNVIQGNKRYT